MNLNEQQKLAVAHHLGPCIVTAVPGSGKTSVITSRVIDLIKNRKVDPRNILCLTFTNKASNEMKERVSQGLAQDNINADAIWISTFHKLCLAILRKHGSLIGFPPNFSIYSSNEQEDLMGKLARMKGYENTSKYAVMHLVKAVNDFREDIIDFEQHLKELTPVEVDIVKDYQETLDELNAIDFSGMLYKSWLLLKNNPVVVESLSKRFKFVLVDEMQDTNHVQYDIVKLIANHGNIFVVGDANQCLHESELVTILDKAGNQITGPAIKIPNSGEIPSWRNGRITLQRYSLAPSSAYKGVCITLESGKQLKVSELHKVYIRRPLLPKDSILVYLMYRKGFGFRVGITNKSGEGYGQRTRQELADKLWILSIHVDREVALLEEKSISLQFGVPTEVFCAAGRGINQDRVDALFRKFGDNGYKVLEHYSLLFEYPMWSAQSFVGKRGRVRLCAHASKGSQVSCEWSDGDLTNEQIRSIGFNPSSAKRSKHSERFRVRKFCHSYKLAQQNAQELSTITNREIIEQMVIDHEFYVLTTASAVREGCYLPIKHGDKLVGDKVISVEPLTGKFVSIDVSDSGVYFNTDGILSHNSIYSWRGAKPENIHKLRKDFDGVSEVTLPRNYRSTSDILQAAQNLIHNNEDATNVELISDKGSGASVKVVQHMYPENEADWLAFQIKTLRQSHNYDWKDFAVLYRTNSLSRAPEMALRTNNIPYRILGGFSFFDRMEIKTALSYLTLLVNPHDTINFNRAIACPKRGLGGESIGRLELMCKNGDSIIEAARKSQDIKLTAKARANLDTFVNMIDKYHDKEDCTISELAENIIKESGFYEHIKTLSEKTESDKSRLENLDELIAGIAEFEKKRSNPSLVDYLQSTQLIATGDEDNSDDVVKLLTIHGAKGLEWPCVNVIGVEHGCMPHPRAESERGTAEERRLMYVAITRARNILNISYCNFRGKGRGIVKRGRSQFVDEMASQTSNGG